MESQNSAPVGTWDSGVPWPRWLLRQDAALKCRPIGRQPWSRAFRSLDGWFRYLLHLGRHETPHDGWVVREINLPVLKSNVPSHALL